MKASVELKLFIVQGIALFTNILEFLFFDLNRYKIVEMRLVGGGKK
jgi:hypothetical protein